MNSFFLKITACLSMFLDHLNYALPRRNAVLGTIGRLAFPIFAFQLTEGYAHTRDFNKYALRLAVFAVLSQYPFSLLMQLTHGSPNTLNIFFTLLIGLMAIRAYDTLPCKPAVAAGVLIASEIATLIHTDYGQWGVLLIFALHVTRQNRGLQALSLVLLTMMRYAEQTINSGKLSLTAAGIMCAAVFIFLYNGKKGPSSVWSKYLIYAFYPLHIMLIYFLHSVVAVI